MDNANVSSDYNDSSLHEECSIQRHRSGPWHSERSEEDYSVSDLRVPPTVSRQASQLRQYLTKLQSTIDSIISGSEAASDSEPPVEDLTSQLHDEYQMMSGTLNQLESLLLGQQTASMPGRLAPDCSGSNVRPNEELGLLDCVVTDRDEVIRRLSERVRSLCRANDQLYMDFESQEQLLTTEMRQLRQQLEEANHAIQLLACHDCGPQARSAVKGGVTVMQAAEEKIAKLRTELQEKEQRLQHLQATSAHGIPLPELARLLQFCLGDLECGTSIAVGSLHNAEDVRGALERLRTECLRLQNAAKEAHSGCMTARSTAQHHAASLAHFLHRFAEQARTLMQRVELRGAGAASGARLKASWAALTGIDVSGELWQSTGATDVFEATLRFLQDLFDFLTQDMQHQDELAHHLKVQLESMMQECNSMKGRTTQLQMWNRDSEERIQQMERDRDEEMEIARRERTEAIARCQSLADHVTRLKAELEAERAERCKVIRESQTIREQVDRNSRRSSDFEQRYMSAQEELAHRALRIKELEEACSHLEADLASQRLETDQLAVKLQCGSQAAEEASAAHRQLCEQVAMLQAERARLEERLATAADLESQLQHRDATEAALRREIALLQRDMEASRRNSAILLQQQNEEALSTIAALKKELQIMQSELQQTRSASKDSSGSQTEDTRTGLQQADSVDCGRSAQAAKEERSSPVIVECSGRAATPPGESECTCVQPEVSEVEVEVPARRVEEVIARYEARGRALELELNAHARAHMAVVTELRKGVRAREALLLRLTGILTDMSTTMNEDRVPLQELRLLFSSHASLPQRVEAQLQDLQAGEEHALMALGRVQEDLSARHHEVLEHELEDEAEAEVEPRTASPAVPAQPKTENAGAAQPKSPARPAMGTASSKSPTRTAQAAASSKSATRTAQAAASSKGAFQSSSQLNTTFAEETSQLRQTALGGGTSLAVQTSLAGQTLIPREVSIMGETSIEAETSLANQTSPFSQTSIVGQSLTGQTSTYDPASFAGQASEAGQASFAGQASQAGQASFAGQTSRADQASFAGQTSRAGQASPAERSLVDRLLTMKRQLEDPRTAHQVNVLKILSDCLATHAEAVSLAESVIPVSSRPLFAEDLGAAPSRATSGAESRTKWVIGTESVDLPEAILSSTQPTTPVERGFESLRVCMLLELFDLEKSMRGASLEEKVQALKELAEAKRKMMEEDDQWDDDEDDIEVIISLIESMSQVVSLESQKRTLERKFRISMRQAEKVMRIGKEDGAAYFKKTLLSMSSVCQKTPEERQNVLLELMQTHVDNMRHVPPQELIVMSSMTDVLKCLLHMCELEIKVGELERSKEELQLRVAADHIVLENLTHFRIPVAHADFTCGEQVGSVSEDTDELPLQEPAVPLPCSAPLPIVKAVEALRHMASQPSTSRRAGLRQLMDVFRASAEREQEVAARDSFLIAAAMLEVSLAIDAAAEPRPRVSLRHSRTSSVCRLSSVLEDVSVGQGLISTIENYKSMLKNISESKSKVETQLTLHVLDAIDTEARQEREAAFGVVKEIDDLMLLKDADREAVLLEISSRLSEYDLDETSMRIFNSFISLVIQCLKEIDVTTKALKDATVSGKQTSGTLQTERPPSPKIEKSSSDLLGKQETDAKRASSSAPQRTEPKDTPSSTQIPEEKSLRQPRPGTPRKAEPKGESRAQSAPPPMTEAKSVAKSQLAVPQKTEAKTTTKMPSSPQISDEEGTTRSRSGTSPKKQPKDATKSSRLPQISDDEDVGISRAGIAQKMEPKGAVRSQAVALQKGVAKGSATPRSPQRPVDDTAAKSRGVSPQKSPAKGAPRSQVSQGKGAKKSDSVSKGTPKSEAASSSLREEAKHLSQTSSSVTFSEGPKFPVSSTKKTEPRGISSIGKPTATMSSSELRKTEKQHFAKTTSESEKIPAAAPRRSSTSRDMEALLDHIPPLLCDELLYYMEARLPPSSGALLKEVQETRARRSNKVTRSISMDKPEKRLNCYLVVRLAEAIEEESQLRKLPPAQQRAGLDSILKRFEAQQAGASEEQKQAIQQAMHYLRVQMATAGRSSQKQDLAQTDTYSASRKSSRSKAMSTRHSDMSGFFFRSDTIRSIAGNDAFPDEQTLEHLLARVPSAIRNEAFQVIEERLGTARKSLAEGVASFRDSCVLEQHIPEEMMVPVARRIIDALRLVDVLKNKTHDVRLMALKAALEEQEAMLCAATEEERTGIHSARRILHAELQLLHEGKETVTSNTSTKAMDPKETMNSLESQKMALESQVKALVSEKKALQSEKKALQSERDKLQSEKQRAEKQSKESLAEGAKDLRELSDSSRKKSGIPSPSNVASGIRRRSLVSGRSQASDLKRFAEVLEQQCTSWLDAEEQCTQEMNHMARRLSQIFGFLSQDCWSEHETSQPLDQASGDVLNALLLVRNRVKPPADENTILDETTVLMRRLDDAEVETKEVALLLVREKAALQAQIDGLVNVNRKLQEQCTLSRDAIKGTAGALTMTSQTIDVLTDQLEVDRQQNEDVSMVALAESAALLASVEAELEKIERAMKVSYDGDVPARLQALGKLLVKLRAEREQLALEKADLMSSREVTMEPEGDRPVQFQFETRLGAAGNVEGHVTMLKEGVEEPMQLDFSMMLAGSESGANGSAATGSVVEAVESHNAAALKPASPSRLGRALQRLTKRRRRSPEVADCNQNNAWMPALCAGCRAPLTATTASLAPGLCAACAGGDSEFSSVSTLTASDSWELASDRARADPPRLRLTSPPRRAAPRPPGLLDAPDGGDCPVQPRAAPRAFSSAQRRQRAEQRLEAAAAFLRKSLTRSIAVPASLQKPACLRDLRQ